MRYIKFIFCCLVLATICLGQVLFYSPVVVVAAEEQDLNKIEWWKKTNFYHIYIRSFKDTDGNGEGDLRGIVEKLDYLKGIGVETLLLSPFYSSPMKDGGYDIDDYTAINSKFGTMKDFEDLLDGLKKRSMRIVVDFVPNHSSNQHKWFKCSENALNDVKNCGKYKDYYVWSNSTRSNGRPTNWISLFGGKTAWKWSEIRKEFYFHQFLPEQPDLNLRNPLVREEFKEIARFWLRKGVDGLRVDAVLHFLEDTINWRDEPQDPMWKPHWDPYDRLLHIYTRSLSESATIVEDWHKVAAEPEFGGNRVIITEAYDSIPKLIEYYGPKPDKRYADMPFNFELFRFKRSNMVPNYVEKVVTAFINATERLNWPKENGAKSPWICWVTGNHDNTRITNRVGPNSDAYKWLAYFLPGVPVSYYGDEIGMHDAIFNQIPQKTVDEGEPTRLIFRSPMAWSSAKPSADFSTNSTIWMPLNHNYQEHNVESMKKGDGKNFLKNFLQLQTIRKKFLNTLVFGDLIFYQNHPIESSMVFSMARTHEKFGNLLMLVNFDSFQKETVNLLAKLDEIGRPVTTNGEPPKRGKILMLNYIENNNSKLVENQEIDLAGLVLSPNQAVLIEF